MVIYITLDENNYVSGWGTSSNQSNNEISINLCADHDFYKTDTHAWKYTAGELVFDEDKRDRLIDEGKEEGNKPSKEEINEMAILELAGILSNMTGGE